MKRYAKRIQTVDAARLSTLWCRSVFYDAIVNESMCRARHIEDSTERHSLVSHARQFNRLSRMTMRRAREIERRIMEG